MEKSYEEIVAENILLIQKIETKDAELITKDAEISDKAAKITELEAILENKELELNTLKRYLFGSKREKTENNEEIVNGVQCSFFGEPEEKEVKEEMEKQDEEIIVHKKKNAKKKKAGIKKSALKDIERETVEVVIEEEKETCPQCNGHIKKIGKEFVRDEIVYIPAKLKKVNYVRNIYKCEECGSDKSDKETPTFIKPRVPSALLPHTFVSPSLATEVIYQKYYMGVPLYRQEKVWDDRGLVIPRANAANWCIKINEYYLNNIYELMQNKLKESCELLHVDETSMQCNHEPGRSATSKSYMWVMVAGELEKTKGVIFRYASSRAGNEASSFLDGFTGLLVTDGYDAYNNMGVCKHAECWAHARRYFYESVPLDSHRKMVTSATGYKGVELIDELFKIEREISELSPEEKLNKRKEKTEPILKNFYEWVNLTCQKYITNKKLMKALNYVLNQKEELSEFLNDGRIPLTNSRAERAIRPFAVHRKNWLFADSVAGAKANAVYYSLIESAKLNNLNIYKYINYLLSELPQIDGYIDEDKLEKYLPWSEGLPNDIRNFEGEYKECEINEEK